MGSEGEEIFFAFDCNKISGASKPTAFHCPSWGCNPLFQKRSFKSLQDVGQASVGFPSSVLCGICTPRNKISPIFNADASILKTAGPKQPVESSSQYDRGMLGPAIFAAHACERGERCNPLYCGFPH